MQEEDSDEDAAEDGELQPEASSPVDEDGPGDDAGYDSIDDVDEDGYKGAEDRERLEEMTQLEREEILADRFEKKERRQEALEARGAPKPRSLAYWIMTYSCIDPPPCFHLRFVGLCSCISS